MVESLREARIIIAGLGLMGGSLALALRDRAGELVGIDPDPRARAGALMRGAVGAALTPGEAGAAVENAHLVILAAPMGEMACIMERLGPHLVPGTTVTDLGGAKEALISQLQPLVPRGVTYVPGHPIAGSEGTGIGEARADLFCGSAWVLTREAPSLLLEMIAAVGADPVQMSAEEHDRIVARTSHLPYLMAHAAAAAARDADGDDAALDRLTAGGFRDTTRVAAGSSWMGADMCLYNARDLLPALDDAVGELEALGAMLRSGDRQGLRERLEKVAVWLRCRGRDRS